MMSVARSFAWVLVLSAACLGCVSTPVAPDSIVLERSELGRPQWVDKHLEVEPVVEKWFVYQKTELTRLDLGIRQTQAAALASHCQLIAERVRYELNTALIEVQRKSTTEKPDHSGLSPEGLQTIEDIVRKWSDSRTCPELELKDIYWESIRKLTPDGPRSSYSVYVLLRLKQLPFDDVLAMTAESLKLSGRADVLPLGEVLRSRMSNSSQRGTNE